MSIQYRVQKCLTPYTLSLVVLTNLLLPAYAVTLPETSPAGDEQPQTVSGAPQRMKKFTDIGER